MAQVKVIHDVTACSSSIRTQIVINPHRAPEEEYQMQLQLFHQFLCILLKATGFPTILYDSNHV